MTTRFNDPSDDRCCCNCEFFDDEHDSETNEGNCHRYAPRCGTVNETTAPPIFIYWPCVTRDDYCGEFQHRRGDQKGVGGGIPAARAEEKS